MKIQERPREMSLQRKDAEAGPYEKYSDVKVHLK